MAKMVKLTREFLERGRTAQGGFTRGQLRLLGVAWPPPPKWMEDLEGKKVSEQKAEQFLNLGKV